MIHVQPAVNLESEEQYGKEKKFNKAKVSLEST